MKRLHVIFLIPIGFALQLFHGLSHLKCSGCRRHRLTVIHCNRLQQALRKLPEKLSTFVAEDAAPHASELNRDDWSIHAFDDELQTAAKRQQRANASDLPFREDA